MTPALYQIGQHVAVCSITKCDCGSDVIPQCVVTSVRWLAEPVCACGLVYKAGWHYSVSPDPKADGGYFAEDELRPINPDTEYLDQPESLETPA